MVGERKSLFHWSEIAFCVTSRMRRERPAIYRMATWNDLPSEIRELVLRFVCINIVAEYTSLQVDPWSAALRFHRPVIFAQVRTPAVLSYFAWVLQTCRYFHDTITEGIKFDGRSTATILMQLQHSKLRRAPLMIEDLCYDDDTINLRGLSELAHSIGLFWNNPVVLEELELAKLLSEIQILDCFPIIYRLLENWAQGHHQPTGFDSNFLMVQPRSSPDKTLSFLGFVIGSSNRYDEGWQVCSIEAMFDTKEWNRTRIDHETLPLLREDDLSSFQRDARLVRDIVVAAPNTWWLLVHDDE